MVLKSWQDNETLEVLAMKRRNQEIIEGVIRSIKPMNFPQVIDGNVVSEEQDTFLVALPGGVTGYCPVSEFREHNFRSYNQFITHKESFVITELDLPNQVAILSSTKAAEQLRQSFWLELESLKEDDLLEETVFEAIVTSYNQNSGVIHARISGQDVYMFRNEWSWQQREAIDVQQGEKIKVKVVLFDKETNLVRVSRRLALPDPRDYLNTLVVGQLIAGRVKNVDAIHGLFVEVENGVVLKASKVSALEQPDIGDFVSCRVRRINPEERRGRLVIISYPRGKRKKKDLGSFLFQE
jgi:small subunit ribosomal protein S1